MSTEEVTIQMRSGDADHTWEAKGYLPFEVYGERFAVTRIPGFGVTREKQWRATHIETGGAVPDSASATMEAVPDLARDKLAAIGEERFRCGMARAREMIAQAASPVDEGDRWEPKK